MSDRVECCQAWEEMQTTHRGSSALRQALPRVWSTRSQDPWRGGRRTGALRRLCPRGAEAGTNIARVSPSGAICDVFEHSAQVALEPQALERWGGTSANSSQVRFRIILIIRNGAFGAMWD